MGCLSFLSLQESTLLSTVKLPPCHFPFISIAIPALNNQNYTVIIPFPPSTAAIDSTSHIYYRSPAAGSR